MRTSFIFYSNVTSVNVAAYFLLELYLLKDQLNHN